MTVIKLKHIRQIPICCILLMLSCSKDEITPEVMSNVSLQFSDVEMAKTTRASSLNSATFGDFGIYAGFNSASTSFDASSSNGCNFMCNTQVTKDWSLNTWSTNVPYYWPLKDYATVSFFAYAPYLTDTTQLRLDPSYTAGTPNLMFTPKSNPQKQIDFCVAAPLFDKTSDDNPLSFHFDHTLTYIKFFANYQGTLPSESGYTYQIKIDKLTLANIMGTKKLTFKATSPYYEWSADNNSCDSTYTLSRANEELTDDELPSNVEDEGVVPYRELEYARGMLFLLPQTINEAAQTNTSTLEIDFSFVRKSATSQETLSQFNIVKDLPSGTVWAPCGVVSYYFTLDVENLSIVKFYASSSTWINDWTDSGNTDPNETIEK